MILMPPLLIIPHTALITAAATNAAEVSDWPLVILAAIIMARMVTDMAQGIIIRTIILIHCAWVHRRVLNT